MNRTTTYSVLLLALALGSGAAGCDGTDTRMEELRTLQEQVRPARERALQDEGLAAQREAIQARIQAAMREQGADLRDRMVRLQSEILQAHMEGEGEALDALLVQADEAQGEIRALQAQVIRQPEIREAIAAFEAAHRARMIEIDPGVEPLLDRMDALTEELSG